MRLASVRVGIDDGQVEHSHPLTLGRRRHLELALHRHEGSKLGLDHLYRIVLNLCFQMVYHLPRSAGVAEKGVDTDPDQVLNN